jgi:hypothetical protein
MNKIYKPVSEPDRSTLYSRKRVILSFLTAKEEDEDNESIEWRFYNLFTV